VPQYAPLIAAIQPLLAAKGHKKPKNYFLRRVVFCGLKKTFVVNITRVLRFTSQPLYS
jgi:hypothetical protein